MVTNRVDVPNFKAVAAPIRVQALPTSDLNSITTVYVAFLCSYKPKKVWFCFIPPPPPFQHQPPRRHQSSLGELIVNNQLNVNKYIINMV